MGKGNGKMGIMKDRFKTNIEHGSYNVDHQILYRQIVEIATDWFLTKHALHDPRATITIHLTNYKKLSCWGESFEVDDENMGVKSYVVSVATDQYLRDFVATLMHELVHVLQWERGEWDDDGEKEAENKQYELADEFWKEGLIR